MGEQSCSFIVDYNMAWKAAPIITNIKQKKYLVTKIEL